MTRDELKKRLDDTLMLSNPRIVPEDLMPDIDAYVQAERARIAQAIERDGFDPGRYTLTHPFGNSLRVMQLVRDDCARIVRAES